MTTSLLTATEERELAGAYARGDEAARERLITSNTRLVHKIAREFQGRGVEYDDLVGDGILGLMEAVKRFDPTMGTRFSTYASFWIKQAIRFGIMNHWQVIRLPSHLYLMFAKYRRAVRELVLKTGVTPDFEEVCDHLNLDAAKRRMLLKGLQARAMVSKDSLEGYDLGISFEDRVEALEFLEYVRSKVGELTAREQTILELRFGLTGEEPMTLREIGQRVGVTREWVRKNEMRALKRIWESFPGNQGRRWHGERTRAGAA